MARFFLACFAFFLLAAVVLTHPVEDTESEEEDVVQRGWQKWAINALKAIGIQIGIPLAEAGFNELSEKFNETFDSYCINNVENACQLDGVMKLLLPSCISHYYESHNYCKRS